MMKIQEGNVKYMDRKDRIKYGVTDEGKQYYFLDKEDSKQLKNGSRIVSADLKEAVDPLYASEHAKNVGLISSEGNEIIPCVNKSIRQVNDDIVLVEPAEPISQSVKDVVQLKKTDPLAATKLVPTPALIKNKMNEKMGNAGRYVFNNQFSEATLVDINGNNVVNNEYYSFIATTPDKIYFSKNTTDSPIGEYSLGQNEVQATQEVESTNNELDVTNVNVDSNVVENALTNEQVAVQQPVAEQAAVGFDNTAVTPNVNEGFASSEVTPVALSSEQVPETQTTEVAPIAPPVSEAPQEEAIEETVVAGDPTVSDAPVSEPVQTVDVAPIAPVEETPVEENTEETSVEEVQTTDTVSSEPVEKTTENVEDDNSDEIVIPQISADEATIVDGSSIVEAVNEAENKEEEVENTAEENTEEEVKDTVEENNEEKVEETVEENTEEKVEDIVEEADDNIDLNDDFENTTLDNMFNEVSSARDVDKDMEEDIFSTSIKTDSIDVDDDFEDKYDISNYSTDNYKHGSFTSGGYKSIKTDSSIIEASKTIVELVDQIKGLTKSVEEETMRADNAEARAERAETKAERAEAQKENAVEILKAYKEKTNIVADENKKLKNKINKFSVQNENLENEVNELRKVNSSQSEEIEDLRREKEELYRELNGEKQDLFDAIQEANKVLKGRAA